ncbi:MAG TPA: type VI secretion system protein TssL, long form [Burkholderiales bacterium]
MSERPKDGVDPDATVMIPASRADDDATVMMPSPRSDDDATVMIPLPRADDDATVMMPSPAADPDATVMIPPGGGADAAEPDPEATIAIPTPGRKRDALPAPLPSAPPAGREAAAADAGALGGINPLVGAANPVLAVVPQIRHTLRHPDPAGLRAGLLAGIDSFEREARAAGIGEETVSAASLALCALLDESAASTPWGADWAGSGMLAERHGEGEGGAKFFALLEKFSADPAADSGLLEFFYVCLALGFEGRHRDAEDGRTALAALRGNLLGLIRQRHAPRDGQLSEHWRGVLAPARRPGGGLALWAAASGAALLLTAVYVGYSVSLGSLSDPVARDLAQLKTAAPAVAAAARPAATPPISEQLEAEIARGEVAVTDSAGMSTIVIRSDRLFASGSARLETEIEPVIQRIAAALERVPGTILVTGHTDDVPIRTARFPSNWELSTERAASVVKLMAGKLTDASRLRAEGVADSAPLAPNDSAANRARNRRVEIILRSAP